MTIPLAPRQFLIAGSIYGTVSFVWAIIAFAAGSIAMLWWLITAGVLAALLIGFALLNYSKFEPVPIPKEAQQTLGMWMGIIFSGEGVAIGVGSGILAAVGLAAWIVPWVMFCVAIHFFPLGYLFKTVLDYWLGGILLLLILIVLIVLPRTVWADALGWGTAICLYLAGWGRVSAAFKIGQSPAESQRE